MHYPTHYPSNEFYSPVYYAPNDGDCFTQCPKYDVNQLGPSLATCSVLPTIVLFMSLLDKYLRKQCDIMDPCSRITSINERFNNNVFDIYNYLQFQEYEFIVIGGGSAGSIVAARLAENFRVLLIEAGPDEPPGAAVPSMTSSFWGTKSGLDWAYKTEPQSQACLGNPEQRCSWPRGKVLGGTGVINGMMYLRGNKYDYDNWAQLIDDEGAYLWNWKNVLPYFHKLESNPQVEQLNLDTKYHGTTGPMTVSQFPYQPPFVQDLIAAAKQQGLPVSEDLNDPKRLVGFAITQTNNRNGTRLSSARAYLRPHANNPNLDVLLNTTVLRLLFTEDPRPIAAGIEFQMNGDNDIYAINGATNEIILSGGTLNSPKLLLASGVGPKEDLEKLNITVVKDLPGVGRNFRNHVAFGLQFSLKNLTKTNHINYATVMEYLFERKGPLASSGMAQFTGIFPSKYTNESYPDLQLFFGGFYASCGDGSIDIQQTCGDSNTAKEFFSISVVNLHPRSQGYLTLANNDSWLFDSPAMQPNYLHEVHDVNVLIDGIQLVLNNFTNAQILKDKYGIEFNEAGTVHANCLNLTKFSDEYWTCAIRHKTGPENHQIGTCKMGSLEQGGVVSSQLSVHGLENVRVIDGSVMPYSPSSNTQGPIFMIGEKGADFIKNDWLYY